MAHNKKNPKHKEYSISRKFGNMLFIIVVVVVAVTFLCEVSLCSQPHMKRRCTGRDLLESAWLYIYTMLSLYLLSPLDLMGEGVVTLLGFS
jgi:hypothetical protein